MHVDVAHPRQTSTYERPHTITHHTRIPIERMEFDLDGTVRHLTSSQRIRLTQDLAVVETNVNVLNDMLAELRPDTVSHDDLNLLQVSPDNVCLLQVVGNTFTLGAHVLQNRISQV